MQRGGGQVEEFGFAAGDIQAETLLLRVGKEVGGQGDAAGVAENFQAGAVYEDAEFEFAAFECERGGVAQAGERLFGYVVRDGFAAYGQADLGGGAGLELRLDVPEVAFQVLQRIVVRADGQVAPGVGLLMQFGDLGDRLAEEAQAVRGLVQSESAGETHLLVEGHLRIAGAVHPGDLNTTAVLLRDVAVALHRVVVAAEIDLAQIGLRGELVAVEGADQIAAVGRRPDPFLHVRFAAHRQGEEVGALAGAGHVDLMQQRPVLQVG